MRINDGDWWRKPVLNAGQVRYAASANPRRQTAGWLLRTSPRNICCLSLYSILGRRGSPDRVPLYDYEHIPGSIPGLVLEICCVVIELVIMDNL